MLDRTRSRRRPRTWGWWSASGFITRAGGCRPDSLALQRSTDTQGRWLDGQRTYESIGGEHSGKTSFRNNIRKLVPLMNRMLRRRLHTLAERTHDNELRGRLKQFADVLVPDGCAFKVAAALSGIYPGTGTAAEFKLHAVHSVRAAVP